MRLLLHRGIWVFVRLLILAFSILSMLTLSLSAYLLAPFYSWLLYDDWRFWRHWHTFPRITRQAWKLALKLARESHYRGMTAFMSFRDWVGPPMLGPDHRIVAIHPEWDHGHRSCGDCGRCCTEIECPVFDPETRRCNSYGSPFWRYFPCGRYPATQAQIDYYGCPKWVVVQGPVGRRLGGQTA